MTLEFLLWLRDEQWVRESYYLSDTVGNTLRGTFAYGVIGLFRRPNSAFRSDVAEGHDKSTNIQIYLSRLKLHELPSNMCRSALKATFRIDLGCGSWVILRCCSAHLESMDATAMRCAQLSQVFKLLDERASSTLDNGDILPSKIVFSQQAASLEADNLPRQYSLFLGDMNFNDSSPVHTNDFSHSIF